MKYRTDEVLKVASSVAQIVETKSPVTLGISLPFHFTCLQARRLGLKSIVMGQLSDELFGGYTRYFVGRGPTGNVLGRSALRMAGPALRE